jgi:GGDEF domain-containing protein
MQYEEMDRVVSMMNHNYDPHAFSVNTIKNEDNYTVVSFEDITQTLIKRIMIQNSANIDIKSGAYDKTYFLQVMKSLEEAARFNEKIIAMSMIRLSHDEALSSEVLQNFVNTFKSSTRQDDMLVHWSDEIFLLVYLVDTQENATQVANKLKELKCSGSKLGLKCTLNSILQKETQNLQSLVKELLKMDDII